MEFVASLGARDTVGLWWRPRPFRPHCSEPAAICREMFPKQITTVHRTGGCWSHLLQCPSTALPSPQH